MTPSAATTSAGLRTTGWAGLVAIVLLVIYIGVLAPQSDDPVGATGTVLAALAVGASSYIAVLVFFGGVARLVAAWDPDGPWAPVVGLAAGLFLAGAVVSDVALLAVPLTHRGTPGVAVDPGLVAVLDQAWRVALVEAQVALGVAIGAATVAGALARRRGEPVPRALLWLGAAGTLALVPLLLMPTEQVVFLVTNQLRLAWIVAVSGWLVVRRGPSTPARRPAAVG